MNSVNVVNATTCQQYFTLAAVGWPCGLLMITAAICIAWVGVTLIKMNK